MREIKKNEMLKMTGELVLYVKRYESYRTIYDLQKIINISEKLITIHKDLGIN